MIAAQVTISCDRSPHRSAQPAMGGIIVKPAMPDHRKRNARRRKRQRAHSQRAYGNEIDRNPPRHYRNRL
jgi:hypothetical protein